MESLGSIVSIEGLVKALKLADCEMDYAEIINKTQLSTAELEKYCSWNSRHYTRNQIAKAHDFELSVICWEKGQKGFIHDYDSHHAWVKPIAGCLREERFLLDSRGKLHHVSNMSMDTNEYSFMQGGIDIHRYSNIHDGRTVSLHLYSQPIDHWNVYNEQNGNADRKVVGHDQVFVMFD